MNNLHPTGKVSIMASGSEPWWIRRYAPLPGPDWLAGASVWRLAGFRQVDSAASGSARLAVVAWSARSGSWE